MFRDRVHTLIRVTCRTCAEVRRAHSVSARFKSSSALSACACRSTTSASHLVRMSFEVEACLQVRRDINEVAILVPSANEL